MLAAIAGRTSRSKLGTAVTVLPTDDPVRVFQRFFTLNAVSGGRAEPFLGRGSFTENHPLFGHDLNEYEQLFEERLEIFAGLVREPRITWSDRTRCPLHDQQVFPRLGPEGPRPADRQGCLIPEVPLAASGRKSDLAVAFAKPGAVRW